MRGSRGGDRGSGPPALDPLHGKSQFRWVSMHSPPPPPPELVGHPPKMLNPLWNLGKLYSFPKKIGPPLGAQWPSSRVLDSRHMGRGVKLHWRHCVVVIEQHTFIVAKYWFNSESPALYN